jgi:flagellar M-ring protein FliF
MEQLKNILAGMSTKQKLSLAGAALAVMLGLFFAVRWNKERDLKPLYTNLAEEDAGALIDKLKASNVEYKVVEGGTIMVPSARVAELRLEMAAAGLPRTGRIGFELFDKANLGTTDFAEHVNFRRALEGELERSLMTLSEVERSRVHVTFAKESLYLDARQPAKASVMVKLRPGRQLAAQNILAIQHLTSSAVEGLQPEAVSVLDMAGNLLSRPRAQLDSEAGVSSAMIDYRKDMEREMLTKIRATLDPLLGSDKYRAGVNVECDFTSGEQSEEVFDPNKSVMVTSQHTEDQSGLATSGGQPGTASSLPRPAARSASQAGGVSRKTESVSYQTSRMIKRLKLPQGGVKRLSVSVLLDQKLRWEGVGPRAKRVLEPPPPETLKVVKDVLAGVVGFQQERGDQILVETLPFDATLMTEPPPLPVTGAKPGAPTGWTPPAWLKNILDKAPMPVWLGAAAALVVVFMVILGLLMKKLFKRGATHVEVVNGQEQLVEGAEPGQLPPGQPQSGFEDKAMAVLAHNKSEQERLEMETLASLQLPPQTKKAEVLKKVIIEQAKKDSAAAAQLIRTWIMETHQ